MPAGSGCVTKAASSLIGVSAVSVTTHRLSETCENASELMIAPPGTKQQKLILGAPAGGGHRAAGCVQGRRRPSSARASFLSRANTCHAVPIADPERARRRAQSFEEFARGYWKSMK